MTRCLVARNRPLVQFSSSSPMLTRIVSSTGAASTNSPSTVWTCDYLSGLNRYSSISSFIVQMKQPNNKTFNSKAPSFLRWEHVDNALATRRERVGNARATQWLRVCFLFSIEIIKKRWQRVDNTLAMRMRLQCMREMFWYYTLLSPMRPPPKKGKMWHEQFFKGFQTFQIFWFKRLPLRKVILYSSSFPVEQI